MNHPTKGRGSALRRWVFALLALVLVGGLVVACALVFRLQQPATESAPDGSSVSREEPLAMGARLYGSYCVQCHGEKGGGDGPAAKFLQPKPRNFGEGKFRLVSAVNRVPTDADLLFVLEHGMPGSAMFPFAHLAESERQALVLYVQHLTRSALEERAKQDAKQSGGELDPNELTEILTRLTKPGDVVEPPADWPAPTAASLARGHEHYKQVCAPCHGATGKGDGVTDQRNDDGQPTRPRDLTRGIFKSGRDRRKLFQRVRLGLPGSPMPSLGKDSSDDSIRDVLDYILSLSDPSLQTRAEHKRTRVIAHRFQGTLTDADEAKEWEPVKAVPIAVSPLWWRNYEEPDLTVAAQHDGKVLAIRLSWHDRTRNEAAIRPQDFEDMAAVQLFKGSPEPFLGMGAADKPVDVWLWNPSIQAKPADYPDVDTAYPRMYVDMYPFEKPGNEPRPHSLPNHPPDFITARKAGNLRADPAHGFTASSLQAGGFGTATMRPRVSQLASARAVYHEKDGRWTVMFRRPLTVPAEGGIVFAAGDKLSVAFALWDGDARDRNGQKLVSIWHDLQLEK